MEQHQIDRASLVRRHNPRYTTAHPADVLTVGNGNLAATLDCSGLQTFDGYHELRPDPTRVAPDEWGHGLPAQPTRPFRKDDYQIPLRTQSSWGWYETAGRERFSPDQATTPYFNGRRMVPYFDRMGLHRPEDDIPAQLEAAAWLHFNPRRLHLGRLTLTGHEEFTAPQSPDEFDRKQITLDLLTGTVEAEYFLRGVPVRVKTTVHPAEDVIATRIESKLLTSGLAVAWVFDSQKDELAAFETRPVTSTRWEVENGVASAHRRVGNTSYTATVSTSGDLELSRTGTGVVAYTARHVLDVTVRLTSGNSPTPPRNTGSAVDDVFHDAEEWWASFWSTGAAISMEGSTAREAHELERRVVLSQYLTAVNCAGAMPPQETGLTLNSWSGKFHLEMHWWHAAHFALWGRPELLERSLGWYHAILPTARAHARKQGYDGARWPKQTDPSGAESPSQIGAFIIWQQPHIIYMLELIRARGKGVDFVRRHLPLVQATAEFMVDFVQDGAHGYELRPPLVPAQESYFDERTRITNPTFELAYWAWALQAANNWLVLAGRKVNDRWRRVATGMRRPELMPDRSYAAIADPPYLIREDHPSMLMAYGWLPPTPMIDDCVMNKTLDEVERQWDFQSTWGWDYPVLSMTASRLGRLDKSIDYLLLDTPKNHYLTNGHNPQRPGFLPIYLPSNGGLLAAIAHLVSAQSSGAKLPHGWHIQAEGF